MDGEHNREPGPGQKSEAGMKFKTSVRWGSELSVTEIGIESKTGLEIDIDRYKRRTQEVLCVVEESPEWIDFEAVDKDKIITSLKTSDATTPVIYDVSDWIDAGINIFIKDD